MKWVMTVVLVSTLVKSALAWGPQGHMIVAEIAEHRLSARARSATKLLLQNQSLAAVSNWADSIKGDPAWAHSKPWHYVDIADGETYETSPHSPHGDVISATEEMVQILKSRSASTLEKQNALKFIIHLVGDIHQPLHVGRPDDQGGNSIRLRFEGMNTNLHQLWDSGMIRQQGMDYLEYARYLEAQKLLTTPPPVFPFTEIVEESMEAREDIYNFDPLAPSPIVLTRQYMERNLDLMNQRLLTGGQRLATLLNQLFK